MIVEKNNIFDRSYVNLTLKGSLSTAVVLSKRSGPSVLMLSSDQLEGSLFEDKCSDH